MPISIACACGAKLRVNDTAAGKSVRCPRCAAAVPVPASNTDEGFKIVSETPAAPPPIPIDPLIAPGASADPAAPVPESTKTCPYCAESIKAVAIVCPYCREQLEQPRLGLRPRRPAIERDLAMEAHLRALAIWYRIGGVLGTIIFLFMLAAAALSTGVSRHNAQTGAALAIMGLVGAVVCALVFMLGHFLAKYSNGARVAAGILVILGILVNVVNLFAVFAQSGSRNSSEAAAQVIGGLIGMLIGTAWNVAVLWALFNQRSAAICTPRYVQVVQQTPEQTPPTFKSPFFWLPLIFVGLFLVIAVLAGIAAAASAGGRFR